MKTLSVKSLFHYISYLQYPFMLVAVIFVGKMYYGIFSEGIEMSIFEDANGILLFMGIAISFSTLQDSTKTQNNFSKRIWENPKKGKIMLIVMFITAIVLMVSGVIGLFSTTNDVLADMSVGFIVLGIGMMGLLKVALEMYENHRLDKKIS